MQTNYASNPIPQYPTHVDLLTQLAFAVSIVAADPDAELEDASCYAVELTADEEPTQSFIGVEDPMLSSMTPLPIDRPIGQPHEESGDLAMSLTVSAIQATLKQLEQIDGFIGVALADYDSGVCFGVLDDGSLDIEVAASANAELVRITRSAMDDLSPSDDVEDILISLDTQYHLIRPVRSHPNLFFFLALDRGQANLAMARMTLAAVERQPPSEPPQSFHASAASEM